MRLRSLLRLAWPLQSAAVVLSCADCGSASDSEPTWLGTADTAGNGAIHVSNPESGTWGEGESWRLVEDLRIGAVAGDGPDVFGEIAAVGVSPNGLIHVIDGHDQEVRVFDPDGRHVRSFGRRGGGPGEFANAYSLDWDRSGRLWVVDPGNGRYAVFDSTGVLLFNAPRVVPGVIFPWLGGAAEDGYLYDVAVVQDDSDPARYIFYQIDEQGSIRRQLPPIEYRRSGPPLASLTLFWLTPRMTFTFDPGGSIWLANTGEYRIIQRTLEGDTLRVVDRRFTTTAVSPEERDSIAQQLRNAPPQLRDPPVPGMRPAIERLFIDPEGRLYVRPFDGPGASQSDFDVFDEDGRFLGTMVSDVKLTMFPALPDFLRDEVYGVTIDSLGVQYVVRALIKR
jgi:hypothetical protein